MLRTIGSIDWLAELKKAFGIERKKITGVCWDEENLYVVSIKNTDKKWEIILSASIILQDWLSDGEMTKPVEQFKLFAMKNNLSDDDIVYSFPEEKVFSYEKQFPAGEKLSEMMINNDIIGTVPFSEGHFWSGFMSTEVENVLLLAAIDEEDGEAVLEDFREAGLSLSGAGIELREYPFLPAGEVISWGGYDLSLQGIGAVEWSHGLQTALAAAISLTELGGINLLPAKKRQNPRLWQNIEIYAAVIVGVICLSMLLAGSWQLNKAEKALAKQQEQMTLIKGELERARSWQRNQQEYKLAMTTLTGLSQKRISWYATMVKLSAAFTKGVYLEEVNGDESGTLSLRGKGADFEAVNQYIEVLEKRSGLFKGTPHLEKSEIDNHGEVSFIIKGIRLNE